MLFPKDGVAHAMGIMRKVFPFDADLLLHMAIRCGKSTELGHQGFDPASIELALESPNPRFALRRVRRIKLGGQFPEMLTRVIEIDDLRGSGEVLIGEVPDPGSSVAEHHFPLGSTPASLPDLMVETYSEFLRRLDGSSVGCGSFVTNRTTFFVYAGLREYAA